MKGTGCEVRDAGVASRLIATEGCPPQRVAVLMFFCLCVKIERQNDPQALLDTCRKSHIEGRHMPDTRLNLPNLPDMPATVNPPETKRPWLYTISPRCVQPQAISRAQQHIALDVHQDRQRLWLHGHSRQLPAPRNATHRPDHPRRHRLLPTGSVRRCDGVVRARVSWHNADTLFILTKKWTTHLLHHHHVRASLFQFLKVHN